MDIKTIIYEINGRGLIIDIEKNTVRYENTNRQISDEVLFNYLSRFFSIINNWEEEYIDNSIIDGNVWKLVIIYTDGNQKQYRGKAKCPINLDSLEEINPLEMTPMEALSYLYDLKKNMKDKLHIRIKRTSSIKLLQGGANND